jgi:hypothetical protein
MTDEFLPEIGSKSQEVIAKASTAFVSTIDGGFAFNGLVAMHRWLDLQTTTNENNDVTQEGFSDSPWRNIAT